MRILLVGFLGATLTMGQAWFPMKDRKVGALDSDYDKRKSADFGFARVFSEEGNLRFEGKDHSGKPWRVWVPRSGGIGATDVFTADFDHDGQQDLLIRSLNLTVGRCIDRGTITVVLFDEIGRPVPWTMTTQVPDWNATPLLGAIVLDANHDGRAEFALTSCETDPSDPRLGEDRRISGIYEARHGRMVPIRKALLAPYLRAAKLIHGYPSVKWLRVMPDEWPDQMQEFDSTTSLRVKALLKGDPKYRHIDFPLVNGRFDAPAPSDSSEILSYDRMLYSDGLQRVGWPYVVLDGPDGRGVYIAGYEDALRRIIKAGYRVKILGNPSQPTWIWVNIN